MPKIISMEHKQKIRDFISANLVIADDAIEFADADNIFERGFVNSLFAMQLLNFVESEFGITVENEDLDMANFSSVINIERLVLAKQAAPLNQYAG